MFNSIIFRLVRQAKIGDLANVILVDENISRCEISVKHLRKFVIYKHSVLQEQKRLKLIFLRFSTTETPFRMQPDRQIHRDQTFVNAFCLLSTRLAAFLSKI